MSATPNIPEKPFFRVNEVCELTDTQPYVLRFWQSEFPQLSPDQAQGGKPLYRKHDVELILRIKHLLYEEEYTIAGARQLLSEEGSQSAATEVLYEAPAETPDPAPARQRQLELDTEQAEQLRSAPPLVATESEASGIARERYDRAVEEITHLRLQLADFENRQRRIEKEHANATAEVERLRDRSDRAVGRLETILNQLQRVAD